MKECSSCGGMGVIDDGDCENGVWLVCPECDGEGETGEMGETDE